MWPNRFASASGTVPSSHISRQEFVWSLGLLFLNDACRQICQLCPKLRLMHYKCEHIELIEFQALRGQHRQGRHTMVKLQRGFQLTLLLVRGCSGLTIASACVVVCRSCCLCVGMGCMCKAPWKKAYDKYTYITFF